jgi:hypothetical protein
MDAKTKLINSILEYIPESRKDKVIYLDRKHPIALDFMSYDDEDEKGKVIAEIKFLFTKSESLDQCARHPFKSRQYRPHASELQREQRIQARRLTRPHAEGNLPRYLLFP